MNWFIVKCKVYGSTVSVNVGAADAKAARVVARRVSGGTAFSVKAVASPADLDGPVHF